MIPLKDKMMFSITPNFIGVPGVIQFKTINEFEEFYSENLNTELQIIVFAVAAFVQHYQTSQVVITEVYRSEEERKQLYKPDNPNYNKIGPHERWEAVDLRAWNLTDITTEAILQYFTQTNIPRFHGLFIRHQIESTMINLATAMGLEPRSPTIGSESGYTHINFVGNVIHFHIQVTKS